MGAKIPDQAVEVLGIGIACQILEGQVSLRICEGSIEGGFPQAGVGVPDLVNDILYQGDCLGGQLLLVADGAGHDHAVESGIEEDSDDQHGDQDNDQMRKSQLGLDSKAVIRGFPFLP